MTKSRKRRPALGQVEGRPATLSPAGAQITRSAPEPSTEAAEIELEARSKHEAEPLPLEIHDHDPQTVEAVAADPPVHEERIAADAVELESEHLVGPRPDAVDVSGPKGIRTHSPAPYLHQSASSPDDDYRPLPTKRSGRGKRLGMIALGALVVAAGIAGAAFWVLSPPDTSATGVLETVRTIVPLPSGVSTALAPAPTAEVKRDDGRVRASTALALASQLRTAVESGAPIGEICDSISATGALPAPVQHAIAQLRPLAQGVPTLADLSQSFQAMADKAVAQSTLTAPWLTRAMGRLTAVFGGGANNPASPTVAHLRSLIDDGRASEVADWVSDSPWAATGSDWIGQARARASALTAVQAVTDSAQQAYDAAVASVGGGS